MKLDGTYSQYPNEISRVTRQRSSINFTPKNGLTVLNISSIYNQFFFNFCGTFPRYSTDFI
jgi:hypothetical protein